MNIFILLMAGTGLRLAKYIGIKKQFYKIGDKELFLYPLKTAIESKIFDKFVLVINKEDKNVVDNILSREKINCVIVYGGNTRNESTKNALLSIKAKEDDNVFIHDADRVLLTKELLLKLNDEIKNVEATVPVIKISDSILKNKDGIEYVDRDNLNLVQTPQVFKYKVIKDIFLTDDEVNTDDFSKAVKCGRKCSVIEGDPINFKVTTIADLKMLEKILSFVR